MVCGVQGQGLGVQGLGVRCPGCRVRVACRRVEPGSQGGQHTDCLGRGGWGCSVREEPVPVPTRTAGIGPLPRCLAFADACQERVWGFRDQELGPTGRSRGTDAAPM